MDGYFNDPKHGPRDAGRLVSQRDGAVIHPDGYVEIRDRMKDVIISGGKTFRRSKWKVSCCATRRA